MAKTNIRKFKRGLDKSLIIFDRSKDEALAQVMLVLNNKVLEKSPVHEYKGGSFKNGWFFTHSTPNYSKKGSKDKSLNAALSTIKKLTSVNANRYYLQNNTVYGNVIEKGLYPKSVKRGTYSKKSKGYKILSAKGFSKQAPTGVTKQSIREVNVVLDYVYSKYVKVDKR